MSALSPILSYYRYTSLHLPIRAMWKLRDPPVNPVACDVLLGAKRGCEERGVNVTVVSGVVEWLMVPSD